MKKNILLFLLLLGCAVSQAQIGIGVPNPAPSAVLELSSASKALLLPRVATTAAILVPVNGMIIYDISANCVKSYENGVWSTCLSSGSAPAAAAGVAVDCSASALNGTYRQNTANTATNTYAVVYTNNSFSAASFNSAVGDVVLSGAAAGLTVSSVSPANPVAVASGATVTVTYTIAGTPTAAIGSTFTANFAKFGLTCSKTATIAGNATSGGSAIFTAIACATATGTMDVGQAVSGVSQTVTVTVGAIGTYAISTDTVNGVTFAGTGSFAATGASQTIVLTASGTPITGGSSTYKLNTTPTCSFSRTTPYPPGLTMSSISPYTVMSTYDTDYMPYTTPAGLATLATNVPADNNADATLDIQGSITTTGVSISIPYTVTGSPYDLAAYTQTITIPAASTQEGTSSRDLSFSYPPATLPVGSSTITATLKAVTSVFNAKKLDVQTGIGSDKLGVLLGQFTYFVNGSSGTTANFAVRDMAHLGCGAFVAPGVYKTFMCHNLGANTSLDPNVAVQGIHGNYYQWGRPTVVANASTPSGPITSPAWNVTNAPDYAWAAVTSGAKVIANDPCPSGFRLPTQAEWVGVINPSNNTASYTGTWADDSTNFGTAMHFGLNTTSYSLTLPATGYRSSDNGSLGQRGLYGRYWSSAEGGAPTNAHNAVFTVGFVGSQTALPRTYALPVRCLAE